MRKKRQQDAWSIKDRLVFYAIIYPLCVALAVVMMLMEREDDDDQLFPPVTGEDSR